MTTSPLFIRVAPDASITDRHASEITVFDPRVAFVMLLDWERRRRAGEPVPDITLLLPHGRHDRLEAALERHLPWVRVEADGGARALDPARGGASGPVRPVGPVGMNAPVGTAVTRAAPAQIVSADELAMLFDASGGGDERPGPFGPMDDDPV